MCHEFSGKSYDRPLVLADVSLIANYYPLIKKTAVMRIAAAITDHHYPQPAVLVAILELVNRSKKQNTGMYPYPVMPFSAMDRETYDRVQSESMYAFHTVFESMALAQRNMELLNEVLDEEFGLQLVLFCDCGCGIVPTEDDPFETEWYKQVNELRSLAEACGTPVIRVHDFTDQVWVSRSLDMGESETVSYYRMFSILSGLPERTIDIHDLANPAFNNLFEKAA